MAESTSLVFKDFVGAEVWKHFLRSLCAKFAQCKVCKKVIKCDGGSTKGLHVHLKSNHQIDLLVKRKNSETHQEDSQEKRPKIATIEHFLNDTTLSAVLARMTAYDGLPFKIFITSMDLRNSLTALGYSLPKSVTTIREHVVKYGRSVFERIKHDLRLRKSKGEKFSLTLDEWTSLKNKRYLNINIHGIGYFWNLGLSRILGSFTAERCVDEVSNKLNEFGIVFEADIIAVTTDGCSMMRKFGRIIPPLHQLCYAHGLQLVIHDVFYQKNTVCPEKFSNFGSGSESETDVCENYVVIDEMEDSDGLTIVGTEQEDALELNFDISGIVGKVRRVSKPFKRSPLKDEILQNYVKEKHSNGLQLILDCKTRWSSLLNMLERISEIQIPVQKALLDLNSDIKISDEEFGQISRIVHSLGPIKIAVEALCRRDANLITGEATLKFLLDEMQNYPPSEYNDRIIEAIIQRSIQERYIEASKITAYLHNPLAKLEKKTVVREFCYTLLSRTSQYQEQDNQTGNEMDQLNSNSDKEVNTTETLPVAMKLQLAIDASLETPQEIPPSGDSLMSSLKFELNIAEHTGKRGILLEKVYQMLLTVPPTSVESYFCNKFRSRLSDTTLNNLCLIRNNRK